MRSIALPIQDPRCRRNVQQRCQVCGTELPRRPGTRMCPQCGSRIRGEKLTRSERRWGSEWPL